jgi:ATP-binding cassette subfamily B protein
VVYCTFEEDALKVPLRQYGHLLIRYLKPQWALTLGLSILLLTNIGLQLVNPQIMRRFLDTAQAGGSIEVLRNAALLFLGIAVVQQVVSVLATYTSENVSWLATNALRADLAAHCLGLDLGFHNARTPGEMIERIDGDVTTLANFLSQFVVQVLGNGLLLLGVLVLLFCEDWRVGLALTVFALLALVALLRMGNIAVPYWAAERQASADLFGFLEERLAGTEDIRANGAEPYVMRHFYRLMRALLSKSLRAGLMVNILLNTMFVLFALGTAAAFAVGAQLFYDQVLTLGTVYIIFFYTTMLERPIDQIAHQLQDLQKAGAGIVRIQELFSIRDRIDEGIGRGALPPGPLAVAFQGVTFGYDDGGTGAVPASEKEIVLRDLSFQLEAGRVLGLLGRTGSGKTTLTRLLFRLYDPDAGAVCLRGGDGAGDGPVDLRDLPLPTLRQRVGMVTQNIQLFHATVRENLTFFDETIPDDRILEVIRQVGLDGWLDSLPAGLDSELEAGGGGLSAGEAQLLAFTRIFLQDPGLVILDEASSRLDPATEQRIERAVDRLLHEPRRTAIIVAHHLATVQRADEILILEEGRAVEQGERAALAADPGSRFYRLLQTGMEEVLV